MKPHRKKRLYAIGGILIGVAIAACLAIYALGQNVNLYLTPSQVVQHAAIEDHPFRMGGMVKKGSVQRTPHSLHVTFVLTDFAHDIPVQYTGILPALFREGQGLVVQGKLNAQHIFVATEVLAKHDEKYMPPGVNKHAS